MALSMTNTRIAGNESDLNVMSRMRKKEGRTEA